MSKTPEEMAAEYATNQDVQHMLDAPRSNSVLYHSFFAGYKAAQAIVEEELQAVQGQRVERPGLGSAEYALKNVLAKMGSK